MDKKLFNSIVWQKLYHTKFLGNYASIYMQRFVTWNKWYNIILRILLILSLSGWVIINSFFSTLNWITPIMLLLVIIVQVLGDITQLIGFDRSISKLSKLCEEYSLLFNSLERIYIDIPTGDLEELKSQFYIIQDKIVKCYALMESIDLPLSNKIQKKAENNTKNEFDKYYLNNKDA